jgi:hypothetical protein
MLNMSRLEDLAFNCINTTRSAILGYYSSGAKRFAVDRAFLPQMSKILDSPQHSELSEVYNDKNNLRHYVPQRQQRSWLYGKASLNRDESIQ